MGLVIRLYGITSPHNFTISIKEGDTPYPLDTDYVTYGTYSGGTTQIEITGGTFNFNTQYWIKLTDLITKRYIIENIYLNDQIAYQECNCTPPLILSLHCYLDELDCDLTLNAVFVSYGSTPEPTATPPIVITQTPTATPPATPTPTPTVTPVYYTLTYNWVSYCGNPECVPSEGSIEVDGNTIFTWLSGTTSDPTTDTISYPAGSTITVTAIAHNQMDPIDCSGAGNATGVVIVDESYNEQVTVPPDGNVKTYTYLLEHNTVIDITLYCPIK